MSERLGWEDLFPDGGPGVVPAPDELAEAFTAEDGSEMGYAARVRVLDLWRRKVEAAEVVYEEAESQLERLICQHAMLAVGSCAQQDDDDEEEVD